jgi:hypothetical protein
LPSRRIKATKKKTLDLAKGFRGEPGRDFFVRRIPLAVMQLEDVHGLRSISGISFGHNFSDKPFSGSNKGVLFMYGF